MDLAYLVKLKSFSSLKLLQVEWKTLPKLQWIHKHKVAS